MSSPKISSCPVTALSLGDECHFFGYYDKSPWMADRPNVLLAHRASTNDRMPLPGEAVDIGLLESSGQFKKVADSQAWNYQQGSMLQWLPHSSRFLLFNDIFNEKAVGVQLDLNDGARKNYRLPFAAISPRGNEALSINFGRLSALKPEYGYAGLADEFGDESCPDNDGVWRIDLETGNTERIVSIKTVAGIDCDQNSRVSRHYINHVMYSQNGRRFCFLHRYINRAGTQNTRLFSCDRDGRNLRLLISGMASHFGWLGDDQLLAWAGERRLVTSANKGGILSRIPVGSLLRRAYRLLGKPAVLKSRLMKDSYMLFDVATGDRKTIRPDVLTSDGHCSFSPDGNWFVTDTYPDRNGVASLLVCRWEDLMIFRVATFRMPPELDGDVRCDLHPRWHGSKPWICVDAAVTGNRQMYKVDVSSVMT